MALRRWRSMSVLDGVRVLDASSGIAGAVAGMFLADFGADVVRVEPPAGAPIRSLAGAAVWDRGKRSLVVDAGSASGRAQLASLLAGATVCFADGGADGLLGTPFDPDGPECAANPGLIHVHLGPYSSTAPWAGGAESDALLAARTGVAWRQGSVEDQPVDSIYPHLVTVQGIWAAAAVVAALIERQRSGLGQRVRVDGIHGVMVAAAAAFTFDPTMSEPAGRRPGGSGGAVPFYRTYRCGDGRWLFLAALTPRFTERAFAALGLQGINDDPRLDGRGRAAMLTPEQAGWVIETIAEVFATAPRHVWLERLAAVGCPVGALEDRDEWLDHPQLAAIGMRAEMHDGQRGPVVMPGLPLKLEQTPGHVDTAAPALGELSEAPLWARPLGADPSAPAGSEADGPLAGIRVLDLGAIIAGPFAASLLAELGADVIKVEPLGGDSFRGPGFAAYNKGQRGIALDLQHADGRGAFLRLVATADIVVDNYRPGVLGRLGLRYDDLAAVNPAIVALSVTGFGEGGPLGQEAGFDPVLQAMSGMMSAQGGDGDPVFFTVPVNDVAAAATSALGACLALFHRSATGQGQRVWTSLAAMSALLQAGEVVRWSGRPPAARGGTDHAGPGDHDRYVPLLDGWIRVQATLAAAAEAQGIIEDDERRGCAEALEALAAARIPATAAQRSADLVFDPWLDGQAVLHRDPRPGREHWWTSGRLARFSRTERADTLVAPALGQHTREVLREAGFSIERIEQLIAQGVAGAR